MFWGDELIKLQEKFRGFTEIEKPSWLKREQRKGNIKKEKIKRIKKERVGRVSEEKKRLWWQNERS
jgi:hypothetical protein